jgi:chromatin remodeling complex protein RSC6
LTAACFAEEYIARMWADRGGCHGQGGGENRRSGHQGRRVHKAPKPSTELAAVVGASPLPRSEVVSKVWAYIKKHDLQDPQNKREIAADDKLKAVFGKGRVTMFEMNKHLAQHLK